MADKQDSFWTKEVLRSMLLYINDNRNKTGNKDFLGVEEHLKSEFEALDIAMPTSQHIQKKLVGLCKETSRRTTLNPSDKHKELWRRGPQSLDFKHPLLKGIFSSKEIKAFKTSSPPITKQKPAANENTKPKTKKRPRSAEDDDASLSHNITTNQIEAQDSDLSSELTTAPDTDDELNDDDESVVVVAKVSSAAESARPRKKTRTPAAESTDVMQDIDSPETSLKGPNPSASSQLMLENFNVKEITTDTAVVNSPDSTLHDLATIIENAVGEQLKHVKLDPEEPVILRDRRWTNDLTEIFQATFGNTKQSHEVASLLARLAPVQPLSWHVFMRSLVAAGILKWAMLPEPVDFEWENDDVDDTSTNATLDALLKVLMVHMTRPQRTKLRHLVHKKLADELLCGPPKDEAKEDDESPDQDESMGDDAGVTETERRRALWQSSIGSKEIHDQAGLLGRRLYLALATLFVPERAKRLSLASNRGQYLPRSSNRKKHAKAARPLPPPRSFDISESDELSHPFSTRIPKFQELLTECFEMALTYRTRLIKSADAIFNFDFPAHGTTYDEDAHSDEFPSKEGAPTSVRKINITTMFGVRAYVRPHYTDEGYDEEKVVARAVVHLLD